MGADNLADIRRWRDYTRILTEFGAAAYPRTGFDLETIKQDLLNEDPAYKIDIINDAQLSINPKELSIDFEDYYKVYDGKAIKSSDLEYKVVVNCVEDEQQLNYAIRNGNNEHFFASNKRFGSISKT
jgi:hypothetical protein